MGDDVERGVLAVLLAKRRHLPGELLAAGVRARVGVVVEEDEDLHPAAVELGRDVARALGAVVDAVDEEDGRAVRVEASVRSDDAFVAVLGEEACFGGFVELTRSDDRAGEAAAPAGGGLGGRKRIRARDGGARGFVRARRAPHRGRDDAGAPR
ncbi:MAG: hypothetical protein RMA76_15555 [Deltaproteobacteria bacterium]